MTDASYYHHTLQEMRENIASGLEFAAQLQARMMAAQAYLNALSAAVRRCPFCGGKMQDMRTLLQALEYFDDMTTFEADRMSGRRVPEAEECQRCRAFITTPPAADAHTWTRDNRSKSRSLAAVVLDELAFVNEVAYEPTAHGAPAWLLRCGSDWYYFPGPKAEVLKRLGVTQRREGS